MKLALGILTAVIVWVVVGIVVIAEQTTGQGAEAEAPVSTYFVVEPVLSWYGSAVCDSGDQIAGGGFTVLGGAVISSEPVTLGGVERWFVIAPGASAMDVFAVCVDNIPLR